MSVKVRAAAVVRRHEQQAAVGGAMGSRIRTAPGSPPPVRGVIAKSLEDTGWAEPGYSNPFVIPPLKVDATVARSHPVGRTSLTQGPASHGGIRTSAARLRARLALRGSAYALRGCPAGRLAAAASHLVLCRHRGWNMIVGGAAVATAVATGSLSLIGFGLNAVVDPSVSALLVWRFRAEESGQARSGDPRRANRSPSRCRCLLGYRRLHPGAGMHCLASGHRSASSVFGVVEAGSSLIVLSSSRRPVPAL